MIFGDTQREVCPVCLSRHIENVWKIPLTVVKDGLTISGARFNKVPLLNSKVTYHFSICSNCLSVFLDPYSSKYWDDRTQVYHAEKAKEKREWPNYTAKVKYITSFVKKFGVVVDLACGGGQMLSIMKELNQPWERMIGVDFNVSSVNYVKSLGFEGIEENVCELTKVESKVADCVVFCESFEHVQSQYHVIQNISRILKTGGVAFMTAQALEANLPVRPEESVYVNEAAIRHLLECFRLTVEDIKLSSGRWKIMVSKI